MTRRPLLLLSRCLFLWLALTLLGSAGVTPAPGKAGEPVLPKPGPVLEAKIQDKFEKPAPATPAVTLAPFFLIMEEGSRVRVRRVQVALEFLQPETLQQFDPQSPGLRGVVYDFLVDQEQAYSGREKKEPGKVLAGLVNRYLGQETVSAVKVDQSFLLLR